MHDTSITSNTESETQSKNCENEALKTTSATFLSTATHDSSTNEKNLLPSHLNTSVSSSVIFPEINKLTITINNLHRNNESNYDVKSSIDYNVVCNVPSHKESFHYFVKQPKQHTISDKEELKNHINSTKLITNFLDDDANNNSGKHFCNICKTKMRYGLKHN